MSKCCKQWILIYQLLNETGGPIFSTSPSTEPWNTTQNANRKIVKKRKFALTSFALPQNYLKTLIDTKSDSSTRVHTVLIFADSYLTLPYVEKQLKDIELFCCMTMTIILCVLGTLFKLCNLRITETSYNNKQLLSSRTWKNVVDLGPVIMHFTKDEETFRRFCVELISAIPQLMNLEKVGVDMDSAIFNGFLSVIC